MNPEVGRCKWTQLHVLSPTLIQYSHGFPTKYTTVESGPDGNAYLKTFMNKEKNDYIQSMQHNFHCQKQAVASGSRGWAALESRPAIYKTLQKAAVLTELTLMYYLPLLVNKRKTKNCPGLCTKRAYLYTKGSLDVRTIIKAIGTASLGITKGVTQ